MRHDVSRHLIAIRPGWVRVLRVVSDGERCYLLGYETPRRMAGVCRFCACTDQIGCSPPCFWMDSGHTVCSRCADRITR